LSGKEGLKAKRIFKIESKVQMKKLALFFGGIFILFAGILHTFVVENNDLGNNLFMGIGL
jgi:hypothetical protein